MTENLPSLIYKYIWQNKPVRGVIYLRTSPEGKCYVGQTIDEKKRNRNWMDKNYEYAGKKINQAREKYGPENFKYDILFELISFSKAELISILNEKETYFIKLYDSFKNGYNSSLGGNNSLVTNVSDSRGVVQLTYGLKLVRFWNSVQEAADYYGIKPNKIHRCCKNEQTATVNSRWIYADDYILHKDNLKSFMKRLKGRPGGYVQLTKTGELIRFWETGAEIERELGLDLGNISHCCSGDRKTCGGYRWMFRDDYEKCKGDPSKMEFKNKKRTKNRPVVQLSLTGEYIDTWKTASEASKNLNIEITSIRKCCNVDNSRKTAGGYMWMWEEDYLKLNKENDL